MNREELLNSIQQETYCRIKPTNTHNGVGVFAIKDIPRGIKPFGSCHIRHIEEQRFTHEEISELKLEKGISDYIYQMYLSDDKYLYIEEICPNNLPIYYFVNHSTKPNLEWIHVTDDYFTTRIIQAGEELFINYKIYGNLLNVKIPPFAK